MSDIRTSGIDASLYAAYDFRDHLWSTAAPTGLIADLLALAEYIVVIKEDYWIYNPFLKIWNVYKSASAQREAKNTFLNVKLSTGNLIDEALLLTYFTGIQHAIDVTGSVVKIKNANYIGSCPQLDGIMSIPLGPRFVRYDNRRFLNIWRDNGLTGDAANRASGLIVLRLIYRSLCNGVELHADPAEEAEQLIRQVESGQYTNRDFEFVMHWLASLYQRPGINLLTNLWFVGTREGTGKGTLIYIMQLILGYNVVGQLSGEEIAKRGWSDHIMAKQLLEVNEFTQDTSFDWLSWIKRNCNEPFLMISQRGQSPVSVINTGNYIFALNPQRGSDILRGISMNDRRNHMIATTDDRQWVGFASYVREASIQRPREFATGFIWVLEQVRIDARVIRYSFVNDFKRSVIESQVDPITVWVENDAMIIPGRNYGSLQLYTDCYREWAKKYTDRILSLVNWGKLMKGHPAVEMTVNKNKIFYTIRTPEPETVIDWDQAKREFGQMSGGTVDVVTNPSLTPRIFVTNPTPKEIMAEKLRRLEQNEAKYP